jgi:hypothetical protein
MNRYSMIFALLVASSFAVHPTPAGNGTPAATSAQAAEEKGRGAGKKPGAAAGNGLLVEDPKPFIDRFLARAADPNAAAKSLQVVFATVPHPVETHLASAFDHNVDALEDGLRDAGYLFDSSLIPWRVHAPRDDFDDDVKEKDEKDLEDRTPGILLFRKNKPHDDAYAEGMLVFLISEKPTQGISYSQVKTACDIVQQQDMHLGNPVRILGPSFSGSFASLVSMVGFLKQQDKKNQIASFLIRSGGVTLSSAADDAVARMVKRWPGTKVDFGSALHENEDWIDAAVCALGRIGIERSATAMLSEGESLYGNVNFDPKGSSRTTADQKDCEEAGSKRAAGADIWRLGYPRDISSLRAGYESQGIFDSSSPMQSWKRSLSLKSDTQGEGDSVQSFGGADTVAAQESVLFGISEFLKAHGIRAVIISATNEEDSFFLTQFLHSRDSNVRVTVIGSTRLFMRGPTAQFRGDMVVDDFPMLPRLHDWTSEQHDHAGHVFADDVAQGIYFAAISLFADPDHWYAEYSAPVWDAKSKPELRPAMYVATLGSDATWPLDERSFNSFLALHPGGSQVEMPFTLFAHDAPQSPSASQSSRQIHVGTYWQYLYVVLVAFTLLYCACFWYANPVSRVALASFAPAPEWRFWLLKVAIPGLVAGGAFRVLGWAVAMPAAAASQADRWWNAAEAMAIAAPAAIALSALWRALGPAELPWMKSMLLSILPLLVFGIWRFFIGDALNYHSVGAILNTYREMHWESGLSLVPTAMFLLVAIGVWASQAGSGSAVLRVAPPLPLVADNNRISQPSADAIGALGRPLPNFKVAKWLWIVWGCLAASILLAHFFFSPFANITTLESRITTRFVMLGSGTIVILMFLDLLQFLWLWDKLRALLRALDLEPFRRSFVPIDDFKWTNLWSFNGSSFRDRRAIHAAEIDCVLDLAHKHGATVVDGTPLEDIFLAPSKWLKARRDHYNITDLDKVKRAAFASDSRRLFKTMSDVGTAVSKLVAASRFAQPAVEILPATEAIQRALASQANANGGRFSDEAEELARLPEWQQTAEKLLCLIYIGFIQTVVARLHTLLASVALLFSLVTLGMAIYPFVPFLPLMVSGFLMLGCISWAFFRVFSQMDTDPVLSRIVNGDDRKLQGNFYLKFGEAMALPLLTIGSSLLPGGSGRLLDLVTSLFSHGAQ